MVPGPTPALPAVVAVVGIGVPPSLGSGLAGFGMGSVLSALSAWVASGGAWLLGQIGSTLDTTTSINLGTSWFVSNFRVMAALAAAVIVPLLALGVVQSVVRQSVSTLLRVALVNVPVALVATGVVVKLVQLGLALSDAMSSAVAGGSRADTTRALARMATALAAPATGGGTAIPAFIVFLGAIVVVFGAVLLWLELLVRQSAVTVAVLFLPLALASLAWPAISHWCRRLVDTLVALVLGKFVIVTVLSLAAAEMARGPGFTSVLSGAAMLLLAAAAPWSLLRLVPFVEAGAVAHLEGTGRGALHSAAAPMRSAGRAALQLAASGAAGAGGDGALALAGGSAAGSGGGGGARLGDGVVPGGGGSTPGGGGGPNGPAKPSSGPARPSGIGAYPAHVPATEAYERAIREPAEDGGVAPRPASASSSGPNTAAQGGMQTGAAGIHGRVAEPGAAGIHGRAAEHGGAGGHGGAAEHGGVGGHGDGG